MNATDTQITDLTCRCGHANALHHHGKSCTARATPLKFCKCELFREIKTGETTVGNKQKKERVKKVRTPKVKELLITRWAATSEDPGKLAEETSKSQKALAYRAVAAAPTPVSFDEIWQEIYRNMQGSDGKTPKNSIHSCLHHLVKDGLLKATTEREAVQATA